MRWGESVMTKFVRMESRCKAIKQRVSDTHLRVERALSFELWMQSCQHTHHLKLTEAQSYPRLTSAAVYPWSTML